MAVKKVPEPIVHTINEVIKEYRRARTKHSTLASGHEAYAVILEELDEMWDDIKKDDVAHAKVEALQVAAMAIAFILEVED